MKKLNSNGFGIVEGLLILVIIGIIGASGYYVYQQNQSNENSDESMIVKNEEPEQAEEQILPEGWVEFNQDGIKFYYPASWDEAEAQQKAEDFAFEDSSTDRNIEIYASKPRLYYSSNAPYLCQLENDKWMDYRIEVPSENLILEKDGSCDRVKTDTIEGNRIYSMTGGALGQDKYIVAVELSGGSYVVISEFLQVDELSDTNGISDELKDSLNTFVKEFSKNN